ncbi:GNAT family N-acetyltransferase [uncultured Algibacter sp.]|uniref:GNAT family N-acetyltransferase n=1 Tax=uncultured Algibacter sp. TaxID=298659 RepID=UPI002635D4CB|nr:GNAT family N-acetyltransferase [uncultured Algibacter sp.]
MIRKGTQEDIKKIMEVTKACAANMVAQSIFQWNEFYPNKASFVNDAKRGELYVLEVEDKIVGSVTVSTFMDEEYIPISWLTPNKNNIYIHRLAIHPKYQGQGYAQQLMQLAENYALKSKCQSVRLDTFSKNKRNQRFYELRGYKKLGDIYFPKQSEYPFYCYELVL